MEIGYGMSACVDLMFQEYKHDFMDTVTLQHLLLNLHPDTHPAVFYFISKQFRSIADVKDDISDFDRMKILLDMVEQRLQSVR